MILTLHTTNKIIYSPKISCNDKELTNHLSISLGCNPAVANFPSQCEAIVLKSHQKKEKKNRNANSLCFIKWLERINYASFVARWRDRQGTITWL